MFSSGENDNAVKGWLLLHGVLRIVSVHERKSEIKNLEKPEQLKALRVLKKLRNKKIRRTICLGEILSQRQVKVCLHIQTECEKIRTRKIPNTDTFYALTPFFALNLLVFSIITRPFQMVWVCLFENELLQKSGVYTSK